MLREIKILKDNKIIFSKLFGKALTPEQFQLVWDLSVFDIFKPGFTENDVLFRYFYKFLLVIKSDVTKRLNFIFITDLNDAKEFVSVELDIFVKTFLNKVCANDATKDKSSDIYSAFLKSVDQAFKRLWPKVSFIGLSGVGKTTIRNLVEKTEIPTTHIPTISGEIVSIVDQESGTFFRIWDYAGQEVYKSLWTKYLDGSDLVFLITDSTIENCNQSFQIINTIKKASPDAVYAIIANKQDLPGALSVPQIKKIFNNVDVFPLVATDPTNRSRLLQFITKITEIDLHALQIPNVQIDKVGLEGACSMDEVEEPVISALTSPTQSYVVAPNLVTLPDGFESIERWIYESRDILKWILEQAKARPYPKQWLLSREYLDLMSDRPAVGSEFDLVWSRMQKSAFVEMKENKLHITDLGKDLLKILANN